MRLKAEQTCLQLFEAVVSCQIGGKEAFEIPLHYTWLLFDGMHSKVYASAYAESEGVRYQ